jgi:hypothetical protein
MASDKARLAVAAAALAALVGCKSKAPSPSLDAGSPPVIHPATARFPFGVYAYFTFPPLTYAAGSYPLSSFQNDLATVLADPAIAGFSIEVGWNQLNPNAPVDDDAGIAAGAGSTTFCADTSDPVPGQPYDWRIYDAAFCQVETWNAAHAGSLPKTIEIMVAPGFNTPPWALSQIPGTCDALFEDGSVPPSAPCSQATFLNSEGLTSPALQPLPLPWDPTYQSLWKAFLTTLAGRYGSEGPLVAIGVAGPTARTYEIIVPLADIPASATEPDGGAPVFSVPRSQTAMWATLLASPSSNPGGPLAPNALSDQPFVDAWSAAIDMYDGIFRGLTLIISTGGQLPNFTSGSFPPAGAPGGPDAGVDFSADCIAVNDDMDCAAETQVEAHLAGLVSRGGNLKATMTSGMTRSRWNDALGLGGAKLLPRAMPGQIVGGSELNTEFSRRPVPDGCQVSIPPTLAEAYSPAACTPSLLGACTSDGCDLAAACIPAACVTRPIPSSQLGVGMYELTPEPPAPGEVQYVISPEQALYNVLQSYFDGTAVASYYGAPGYSDGPYTETLGFTPMNYLLVYYQDIEYAARGVNDAGPMPSVVVLGDGGAVVTTAQAELDVASSQLTQTADPLPPEPPPP